MQVVDVGYELEERSAEALEHFAVAVLASPDGKVLAPTVKNLFWWNMNFQCN